MSAALIEILIQESSRDGILSRSEIETIYKEAESMGVSKALVDSLIEEYNSKLNSAAAKKAEEEIKRKEKDDNRKYDVFKLTFEKIIRKWIQKSKDRILDKADYMPELRREAQQKKIEIKWLDEWVLSLEKSEQEIAGIKPKGIFGKFKDIFK